MKLKKKIKWYSLTRNCCLILKLAFFIYFFFSRISKQTLILQIIYHWIALKYEIWREKKVFLFLSGKRQGDLAVFEVLLETLQVTEEYKTRESINKELLKLSCLIAVFYLNISEECRNDFIIAKTRFTGIAHTHKKSFQLLF